MQNQSLDWDSFRWLSWLLSLPLKRQQAKLPLDMYSYTIILWVPSLQHPINRTMFGWLRLPKISTSVWKHKRIQNCLTNMERQREREWEREMKVHLPSFIALGSATNEPFDGDGESLVRFCSFHGVKGDMPFIDVSETAFPEEVLLAEIVRCISQQIVAEAVWSINVRPAWFLRQLISSPRLPSLSSLFSMLCSAY